MRLNIDRPRYEDLMNKTSFIIAPLKKFEKSPIIEDSKIRFYLAIEFEKYGKY